MKAGKLRLKGEGSYGWYEEQMDVKYKGDPMTFHIHPQQMMEVLKRSHKCMLGKDRLLVNADKFKFVTCLMEADD